MPTRAYSRIYNPSSLEVWFANVGDEWEQSFDKAALQRGRQIYREGLISGVELSNDEAIVHCTFARKDTCYSVIEWTKAGPRVRSSTEDDALEDVPGDGLGILLEHVVDEEAGRLVVAQAERVARADE